MSRWSVLLLGVLVLALGAPARPHAATPTPFNGRIAFADVTGIASMNPDGTGQWGVELGVGDTEPAWSPDGSQLAIVSRWAGRYGIAVMQPDGSGERLLTSDPSDEYPAWSPDGTRIAYDRNGQLWTMNADGTNRNVIESPDGWASHPSWSPDGTKIVFAVQRSVGYDIASSIEVVDVASGAVHALTTGPQDSFPAWSPRGDLIAFNQNGALSTMNADGTNAREIGNGGDAAWSPDGMLLAYTREGQIWTSWSNGQNAQQLTQGDGNDYPAWQPLGPGPSGCTLWGTAGNDLLVGTDRNDVLCGEDGNDTLIGLGGNDVLFGDAGDDHLAGGTGNDQLDGGAGNDVLDARGGTSALVEGDAGHDAAYIVNTHVDRVAGIESPRVDPDLAAWRPATADAWEPTNPPERAFDGDASDWWNSGGYPSHWLQVDLGQRQQIGLVRLTSMEYPAGSSILLLGSTSPTGPFTELHRFAGPIADYEQLSFKPRKPWRNVRYLRLFIPVPNGYVGWVACHELAVYGPRAARSM